MSLRPSATALGAAILVACASVRPEPAHVETEHEDAAPENDLESSEDRRQQRPDWDSVITGNLRTFLECPDCTVVVEAAVKLDETDPSHIRLDYATDGMSVVNYYFLAHLSERGRVYPIICSNVTTPACALVNVKTDHVVSFFSIVPTDGQTLRDLSFVEFETSDGFNAETLRDYFMPCKDWPGKVVIRDPRCSEVTSDCKPWPAAGYHTQCPPRTSPMESPSRNDPLPNSR